ncbi:MAG: insulinase family protein [Planctomycetales bacterium]|nr:insulinase family protein [Planctomycetales bacterium]
MAQTQPSSIQAIRSIEGIDEYRLANGAQVLLFPDSSKSHVTVNMTVFVGSRHEGYGEAGMAHLLEHMLFKGTPLHPDVPTLLTERAGPGNFNGTTWVDRTNYYETLPASDESLEFAIRFESDRLVNSHVRGEDLASEMTVVRNEFEQGENDPFGVLLQRMTAAAYEWHNYGRDTIGNRSDIERVPVVRLKNFYRKFYRPDNVMLIVAGKFDPESALQYAEQYLGSIPRPETPIDNTYTVEPPQDGERTVVLRRVGNTQLVGALYHIPAGSHPDFPAMRIVASVLSAQGSGRLYKSLVEAKLASAVFASARAYHDPGMMLAAAQLSESGSLEDARQVMLNTIENELRETPITEAELERARQRILKERELEANSTDRIAVALSDWAAQGDWRLYFLFRDIVESLTVEEVQAAAERYLVRNNRTVGLYIPSTTSERIRIPDAPDLNQMLAEYQGRKAVSEGEAFEPTPTNIEARTERGQLTDGIKYAFLPKKTRGETVNLMLTLRYGNEETLKGRATAADFLPSLMMRGTDEMSFVELQDTLNRLRAELRVSGLPGLLQVSLKTQKSYLPEVLGVMQQMLRTPKLDEAEFEILRRQALTGIEQSLNDPQTLASVTTERTLAPYPPEDVRYVATPSEDLERVNSVNIEQIRELYRDFVSAQAGELAVVGDFDPESVREIMKEALNGWTSEIPYQRIDRPAHTDVAGALNTIQTPDKENAVYVASQHFELSDSSPNHAELVLGNFVLGGGSLSSRLGTRVRQQDGLSYGVGSMVSASSRDERTELSLFAIANPDNKDRLLASIEEVFRHFAEHGMTGDELARAKDGYLQQQMVTRTDDQRLASLLVGTLFNDRTMAFYADQDQKIADAKLEEVNEVIKKYFNMDRMVISIAGDFDREK